MEIEERLSIESDHDNMCLCLDLKLFRSFFLCAKSELQLRAMFE